MQKTEIKGQMELFNSLPEILYLGFYHPLYNLEGDENEYFKELDFLTTL